MKLYRFSPIKTQAVLFKAIKHIHFEGFKLCKNAFGQYFSNAGNIGVFCHYDEEFINLIEIRKQLTHPSDNPNQKYFELVKPIVIERKGDVPETIYTHLYIRRPDPYRAHVGDVDFYLEEEKYTKLKRSLEQGAVMKGVRIFDRKDLDMVEVYDPDIDVVAYISTTQMTENVRVKLSDATNL